MTAVKLWRQTKFSRKSRLRHCTLLICLVIAPVVCALIFSESMMNGIAGKYICLSDGHLQINNYENPSFDLSQRQDLSKYIYSADKTVSGYVLLYSSESTASCLLKGVEQSYFNEKRVNELTIGLPSETKTSNSLKGITISRSTAKTLGVNAGDKLAMVVVSDSKKAVLRPYMVYVDSVFYTGYDKLDEMLCFTDYKFAESLFGSKSGTTEILVNDAYTQKLEEVETAIGKEFYTSRWTEHNALVYSNFITSREAIFIVLATIIVVAAFYTASVSQQLIQDDMMDIAKIKLIGASDSLVRHWAFSTVFTVTLAGSLSGTILGIGLGYLIGPLLKYISSLGLEGFSHYLLDFKVSLPVLQIIKILSLMISISAATVFLSLRRTRKIRPVQLFTD